MSITTPDADQQDRADMERLAAGQDAALNDLMDRHGAAVFHFLCRMLGNEEDASDLAQESFVRVFKSKESFRPDAKFTTWLYTIAANLARNHFRWRSRHPNIPLENEGEENAPVDYLPSGGLNPTEASMAAERGAAVRSAIHQLPEDMREAIVLCELEERQVAEAATILKTTPKAVESRLYRARQILRKKLEQWL
jgi:RNA polymerase sigma-70 factor (ECF subfamily)